MTKRQRVSEIAGTSAIETGALRLGVSRPNRTNLAPNPTCSVNTTGYAFTSAGAATASRQTGTPGTLPALSYYRVAWTALQNDESIVSMGSTGSGASAIAVTAGQALALSVYTRANVASKYVYLSVAFYNAAGGLISTSSPGSTVTMTAANTWYRPTWTGVAPLLTARVVVRAIVGPTMTSGNNFDVGALLVEQNASIPTLVDTYFDGDSGDGTYTGTYYSWTGTAGASTSLAQHAANVLAAAPNGNTSRPSDFPAGMSGRTVAGGLAGYPLGAGILITQKAVDQPLGTFASGLCSQTFYPDNDSGISDSSKVWTRSWNSFMDTWNDWTSARIVSDKAGNDLYVQVVEPDHPEDGDLWISPGVTVPASSVTVAGNLFTNGNWYRIASSYGGDPAGGNSQSFPAPRAGARFILEDGTSGRHQRIEFAVSMAYGRITKASVRTIDNTSYNTNSPIFTKVRITYKGTYDQWFVDVFAAPATVVSSAPVKLSMIQDSDWLGGGFVLNPLFGASTPVTPANSYLTKEWAFATPEGSDNWTAVTYEAGSLWIDYGTGFAPVSYMLDYNGDVRLRGTARQNVSTGTAAKTGTIFTLPPELAPGYQHIHILPAGSAGGLARVDIAANGAVTINAYFGTAPTLSQTWVAFNQLRFRPGS